MAAALRAEASADPVVSWEPQPKQEAFITCPADDVGFGGSRGGGKSDAVIGDFIDHEDTFGQHAIAMAFRRERTQLVELIERAKQVMNPLGYKWHEQDKYFRGPKGGRLRFTYLDSDSDADAYQGHSYTRLYPEELGNFPNESPINKLQATLRSGSGVPCRMKGTMNPGGVGHSWVKERYRLSKYPKGYELFTFDFVNPFTKKTVTKTRMFIPSSVKDNRFLGDDYVAGLFQVGSEALVRAWLEGDWDAVEGAFFDCWRPDRHVVAPFPIPAHWNRFVAMDWGFAAPFSVGWWAVVSDPVRVGPVTLPRGCLVKYREWSSREGLRLTADKIAEGILHREQSAGERRGVDDRPAQLVAVDQPPHIAYGVLDPSCWDVSRGTSIAEQLARGGVFFRKADNRRTRANGAMSGWDQVRLRLQGDADGNPMMVFFSTCEHALRTIPVLQHDSDNPEDLDTDADDHVADETRYACMSRPYVVAAPDKTQGRILSIGPENQVRLDDLWPEGRSTSEPRI